MKSCPFCRARIPQASNECTACGRVLVERVIVRPGNEPTASATPVELKVPQRRRFASGYGRVAIVGVICALVVIGIVAAPSVASPFAGAELTVAAATKPTSALQPTAARTSTPLAAPQNGTILEQNAGFFNGMGSLNVINQTGQDALVKLVPEGGASAAARFIVANGAQYEIGDVTDGAYRVMFDLGEDWERQTERFRHAKPAQRFDDPFAFKTTETSSGWRYTTYEVTLHTVPLGTARTSTLSDSEFLRY